jgi:3-carboxy-cis,cis-muconate cycloisomerase
MSPFSAIFVPDELAEALSDRAWLEALLEAERALVNACALASVVPAASATAIADACSADLYDVDELAEAGRAPGNPVEPLVRAMRARVGEAHAEHVHRGATSQDILDSASILVARNALGLIDAALEQAASACAELAAEHRRTLMAARTLLQQAVPTTFGYKAACWLVGLVESRATLNAVASTLPAQLGGAGGTLAALGANGMDVHRQFAVELDLREPTVPWHTIRTPIAELAGALAAAAGSVGKIALDIVLLAQTEVAEVAERDSGGSSTMPHKRNPIAAVLANACVRHARANSALLVESMVQEQERAVGAWHAEWHALTSALAATGGAAASLARSLDGLEVDVDRMRANVTADTLSEAHRLGLEVASPEEYLGSTDAFIERALEIWRNTNE